MSARNNNIEYRQLKKLPRFPQSGSLDITYRCNNKCKHCWISIDKNSTLGKKELSFEAIKEIVLDARALGCSSWALSGGEPMMRRDFIDIFDFITSNSATYSLNTNGTLITPKIAKIMKRKGMKMVALYGATAKAHDGITRNKGSFQRTIRGMRYLKEQRTNFVVQIIPMKENYFQFWQMVALAKTMSKAYRVGVNWLYLSAEGCNKRNKEILSQRLSPKELVQIEEKDFVQEEFWEQVPRKGLSSIKKKINPLKSCFLFGNRFHVDAYGRGSCCFLVKDPQLRCDLKRYGFKHFWEKEQGCFAKKANVSKEWEYGADCSLHCPVYSYLEHGDYSKPVRYAKLIQKQRDLVREKMRKTHRRYYNIADLTIQLDADVPITDKTFLPKIKQFEADRPKKDKIHLIHYFEIPNLSEKDFGELKHFNPPLSIYMKNKALVYVFRVKEKRKNAISQIAVFNKAYNKLTIYNKKEKAKAFSKGKLALLTNEFSDQIFLGNILAYRKGCYFHSSAVIFKKKALLFLGHSGAGKSTMIKFLRGKSKILCDDRNIVRSHKGKIKVYGTWSHGEIPEVSTGSGELKAIYFLNKAKKNCVKEILGKKRKIILLLNFLVKHHFSTEWWENNLSLMEEIAQKTTCYNLYFDTTGKIADML